jgi:elongation factor Ts
MISAEEVKSLREETGISIMECKKALEASGGDREKALLILKKRSTEVAAKKTDREVKDGFITVEETAEKITIVTLQCETDFVSKNADFQALGKKLATIALQDGAEKANEVSKEEIDFVVQKIGENIKLGKIEILEKSSGNIGVYIHDGKKGTIAILDGGDVNLSKDIAMHITAMRPEFTTLDEIPAETKEAVTALMKEEVDSSKPADIQEKMLIGKVAGYFKEKVLTEQSFIKDQNITIGKLLESKNAKIKSTQSVSI